MKKRYNNIDYHKYKIDFDHELTNLHIPKEGFDFYCPVNYKDYAGVYEPKDFCVIRDPDLLVRELQEMLCRPTIDFYYNGIWHSKGIKGINRDLN